MLLKFSMLFYLNVALNRPCSGPTVQYNFFYMLVQTMVLVQNADRVVYVVTAVAGLAHWFAHRFMSCSEFSVTKNAAAI